jgi:hypothetical protein
MFSFHSALDRLRQKPEATRARYLFFSVGISFLGIVALWTFSLKASFGAIMKDDTADTVLENVRNMGKNAPVSLEELMKAGKTLAETADSIPEAIQSSPQNQITNFLPNEGMLEEEQTTIEPRIPEAHSESQPIQSPPTNTYLPQNTPTTSPESNPEPSSPYEKE